MPGYFKNEAATAETIIGDWLHTGDIGYYDQVGHLRVQWSDTRFQIQMFFDAQSPLALGSLSCVFMLPSATSQSRTEIGPVWTVVMESSVMQ